MILLYDKRNSYIAGNMNVVHMHDNAESILMANVVLFYWKICLCRTHDSQHAAKCQKLGTAPLEGMT